MHLDVAVDGPVRVARGDHGSALVGLVAGLAMIGAFAAVVVMSRSGHDSPRTTAPVVVGPAVTGTSPALVPNGAPAAAEREACLAMVSTIETASEAYQASAPTGRAAAGLTELRDYLKDLPPFAENRDGTSSVAFGGGTITYHSGDGSVTNTCST